MAENDRATTLSRRRTPAIGEYLVRVYTLLRERSPVVGVRLAERMNVSPPSVTQALRRMARDGLVEQDRSRGVQLTDRGRGIAEATVRRHYLLERLLVDQLGYNWADADDEAAKLEQSLSPQLEEHLFEQLGRPATCPHGNPFPGSPDEERLLFSRTLASALPGERVSVVRVTEEGEEDPELMHFLLEHRLFPEARIAIVSADERTETVKLEAPSGLVDMTLHHAEMVRVSDPDSS